MNKKIVSILVAATILLSLIAFVPKSNAATSNGITQPNPAKIAPNLQAQMNANPTGDNPIIVVLNPGVDQASAVNAITNLGGTINAQFTIINAIATSLTAEKILALTSLVGVNEILVNGKKYLPIDPLGDDSGSQPVPGPQPGYYYAQFPFDVGADKAWSIEINGTGVVVADLDTGIWYQHPDLAGVVTNYKIFTSEADTSIHDGNGHGTATTGLVAAQGILTYYGFLKVLGVAFGAKVIGGKVLTDAGWGWDSWIIAGIQWAVASHANIITMSIGGLEVPNDGYDPTALALDAASQQGVTCFVAAGNSQGAGTVGSPGDAKDVITVGASTDNSGAWNLYGYWPVNPANVTGYENNQVIYWSSGGATADGRLDPDICAPGAWGETLDTYPNYLWLQFGGTSMATPVAAGVGALIYQAYKQAHGVFPSPAVVRDILMNTATNLGLPANRQGAGLVNAYEAVEAALNSAPYSTTDEINTGILPAGASYTTSSTFTSTITSATATQLQYVSTTSFSGLSIPGPGSGNTNAGSTWLPFTIPAGIDYADVQVKFDPVVSYGTPIRSYNGSTWTDVHINTALYYERGPNDLVLINYAYAHTNVQEFDARIDFGPGTYVLRFWNAYPTVSPVDAQVSFYKFVPWTWVSTAAVSAHGGNKLLTTISVPYGTAAGFYSGFVTATVGGSSITIPIVITVPAQLAKTFTVQANVMNEPRTGDSGDWFYIPVRGFIVGPLMLTVTWTTPDADFDVYLVNPAGQVRAASMAPLASLGYEWYTTTGTTMEVLSTSSWSLGYWYVGIRAIYFGNTFSQTVTVNLSPGSPINTPDLISLQKGTSKTFTVSNNIPGTVNVQTMALSFATETFAQSVTGNVTSYGASGIGYDYWIIPVTPDMITMKLTLTWVGTHSLSLILWDPFGRNAGVTAKNGGSLTISSPAIGYWEAVITINDVGSQPYTLSIGGLSYQPLAGVTITPTTFTLTPKGTQTMTITTTKLACGLGQIVYYDMTTSNVYSSTLLAIGPSCTPKYNPR